MAIVKSRVERGEVSPRLKRQRHDFARELSDRCVTHIAKRHCGNGEPTKDLDYPKPKPFKTQSIIHDVMSQKEKYPCVGVRKGEHMKDLDYSKPTPFKNQSLHDAVSRKDNNPFVGVRDLDCRNRKIKALVEFQSILSKVFHELSEKDLALQSKAATWVATCAAARRFLEQQSWACVPKQLGHIAGLEIGDKFQNRAELKVVGLHHQDLKGIDSIKRDGTVFATSIVASGRYDNDVTIPGTLIYTGQGGNPSIGCKELVDQKIKYGNLALMNSMKAGTSIRVVYCFKLPKDSNHFGLSGKKLHNSMYVYDGLYVVDRYWQERGKYGKLVFKFLLKRMLDQPKSIHQKFVRKTEISTVPKAVVCVNDISRGKEKVPIRLMKALHEENLPSFDYITEVIYPKSLHPHMPLSCNSNKECKKSETCVCGTDNSAGSMPYDSKQRIEIPTNRAIIYECNRWCKCPLSCANRVTQNGISLSLEVFWSKSRRWGVRSRSYIPKGSFVCEYIGEVLPDEQVDRRISGIDRDLLFQGGTKHVLSCSLDVCNAGSNITIDATLCGNVGRFVNHCTSPNLCAQFVLYDHSDVRMPHVMLFATRDIPPLQELTLDYSYTIAKFGKC